MAKATEVKKVAKFFCQALKTFMNSKTFLHADSQLCLVCTISKEILLL